MNNPIFFPFYNIHSHVVKTAVGLKDNRSVEKFFYDAGIRIIRIGKKKCVAYEDLIALVKTIKPVIIRYKGKSDLSKEIDDIE